MCELLINKQPSIICCVLLFIISSSWRSSYSFLLLLIIYSNKYNLLSFHLPCKSLTKLQKVLNLGTRSTTLAARTKSCINFFTNLPPPPPTPNLCPNNPKQNRKAPIWPRSTFLDVLRKKSQKPKSQSMAESMKTIDDTIRQTEKREAHLNTKIAQQLKMAKMKSQKGINGGPCCV